ncbi:MAG TPA: hypothetical protein VHC23_00285 [Jatrophihabitans sp.]|nr:hypothetical protein [Jatrophihabitans sp.]
MSEPSSDGTHRRRRRRATAAQGPPPGAPAGEVPAEPAPHPPAAQKPAGKPRRKRPDSATDRGLRDIVGAGRSQLGVSGALRGRDVNRPTEQDLAEAEREVVIVRRHWQPRDAG